MSKSNWTMRWFKMWHNFDDEGKWTAEIDNDELGAWLRLLKYASKCYKRGTVQIDGGVPYSREQLNMMIRSNKPYIEKWASQGAITIKNGIITIENWESYQCEQDRKDKSTFKQTLKQTPLKDTLTDSTDLDLDLDIDLDKEKKKKKDIPPANAVGKINCVKIWIDEWNERIGTRQIVIVDGKETTKKYIPTDRERGNLKNVADRCENEADYRSRVVAFLTSDNFANDYTIPVFLGTLNSTKNTKKTTLKSFGGERYGRDY